MSEMSKDSNFAIELFGLFKFAFANSELSFTSRLIIRESRMYFSGVDVDRREPNVLILISQGKKEHNFCAKPDIYKSLIFNIVILIFPLLWFKWKDLLIYLRQINWFQLLIVILIQRRNFCSCFRCQKFSAILECDSDIFTSYVCTHNNFLNINYIDSIIFL